MDQDQYEKKYNELVECLADMQRHNSKRMRAAIKSLIIVPTVFLVLLLFTNSSKTVFLVLWIVSMFIIAAILIVIEYQDYTLKKTLERVGVDTKSAGAFEYDNYEEAKSSDEDNDE